MSEEAISVLRKSLRKKIKDRFKVGDVIKWTAAGRFTYAAVKTESGWFTTARTGNVFVDSRLDGYEDLVEILARSEVSDVMVSTGWEAI